MDERKITLRRAATAVLVLSVMAVIFAFSARTAAESMENSDAVVDKIIVLGPSGMEEAERENFYQILSFIVRKGAHMAEFALLCFCMALHLEMWRLDLRKIALFSLLFTVCYAATDEFHQRFVPGRSGEIKDVIIDSAGAAIGMLVYAGARWLIKRRRYGAQKQDASKSR